MGGDFFQGLALSHGIGRQPRLSANIALPGPSIGVSPDTAPSHRRDTEVSNYPFTGSIPNLIAPWPQTPQTTQFDPWWYQDPTPRLYYPSWEQNQFPVYSGYWLPPPFGPYPVITPPPSDGVQQPPGGGTQPPPIGTGTGLDIGGGPGGPGFWSGGPSTGEGSTGVGGDVGAGDTSGIGSGGSLDVSGLGLNLGNTSINVGLGPGGISFGGYLGNTIGNAIGGVPGVVVGGLVNAALSAISPPVGLANTALGFLSGLGQTAQGVFALNTLGRFAGRPTGSGLDESMNEITQNLVDLAVESVSNPGINAPGAGVPGQGVPGTTEGVGVPGVGLGLEGLGLSGAPADAPSPDVGVSSTGDAPGTTGDYHQGGIIPNIGSLKLSPRRITVKEGEFVIRPEATRIFAPILSWINDYPTKKPEQSLDDLLAILAQYQTQDQQMGRTRSGRAPVRAEDGSRATFSSS